MTTRREFTKTISIGSFGALALGATSCATGEDKSEKVVWPSVKLVWYDRSDN